MEINLDYIKAQLQRRRDQRQLAAVGRGASVTVRTLQRIMAGQSCSTDLALRLQDYLRNTQALKRLTDGGQ